MAQSVELTRRMQNIRSWQGIKLTSTEIDRMCADLKLAPDMKHIFELLRLDPEQDATDLRHVFHIPEEDSGHPDTSLRDVESPKNDVQIPLSQPSLHLESKNKDGNTVLHCITLAMKKDNQNQDTYMELFDAIISFAYAWWCQFKQLQLPDDDESKIICKRKGVRHLTSEIHNSNNQNVLEVAFQQGTTAVVEKLVMMEGVTCTPRDIDGLQKFDVTNIMGHQISSRPSCIELLLSNPPHIYEKILNLSPVKAIEDGVYDRLMHMHYALGVLHILYMSLISPFSIAYLEERRNSTFGPSQAANTVVGCMLVEPIYISLLALCNICLFGTHIYKVHDMGHLKMSDKMIKFVKKNLLTVFYTPYIFLVAAFVYHVFSDSDLVSLYYITSLTLLYGWLLTFIIAYGIRDFHFFLQLILHLIWENLRKIILVYLVLLLAFSFAVHSQFVLSEDISKTYKNPFHTIFLLFNIMLGIGEMFNDKLESDLEKVGLAPVFTKLLYIVYIIIVALMLLNLLIAMMNKSYSRFRNEHKLTWRANTVELAFRVARQMPIYLQRSTTIRYGTIFNEGISDGHLYVEVSTDKVIDKNREKTLKEMVETIMERVQFVEAKMNHLAQTADTNLRYLKRIYPEINDDDTPNVTDDGDEIRGWSVDDHTLGNAETTVRINGPDVRDHAWMKPLNDECRRTLSTQTWNLRL